MIIKKAVVKNAAIATLYLLKNLEFQDSLHYSLSLSDAEHAKFWFASYGEALKYQIQYGGNITLVGNQAVIS
ncbi:MAG: hypothetical protein AAGB12_08345 [Pseudomonadota bacterium]